MTSRRFFINKAQVQDTIAVLAGNEHHHLVNVLRKQIGERIWLFDETGIICLAQIHEISREKTRLTILEQEETSPGNVRICLAQALLKSKKMDFLIQKATELGTSDIFPVDSSRAVSRVEDKVDQKLSRWKKIVREAGKQSGQTILTAVHRPVPLRDFLEAHKNEIKIFLCDTGGQHIKDFILSYSFQDDKKIPSSVTLLCGPEGGFTKEEEDDILEEGFIPVSLGKNILRAETAVLSGLSVFLLFWNNLPGLFTNR